MISLHYSRETKVALQWESICVNSTVPTWYLLSVMVSTLIAFLYHVTVGLGNPVAWQGRSTTLPTELMVIGSGETKNSGGTAEVRERKIVILFRLVSNKLFFKYL